MFGFLKKARSTKRPAPEVAANPSPLYLDAWPHQSKCHSGVDAGLMRLRVAEAVAWCESLSSPTDLRSVALRPSLFHDGPEDVVRDLGQRRQQQLRIGKLEVRYETPVIAAGRFMLYFPDENLSDGYAELVSGGFFDAENLPAYDTWVSFVLDDDCPRRSARRYLLCYVPAWSIDAADSGIEGNPESCIVWLEQSDASVRRQVEVISLAPYNTQTST